MSVPRPCLDCGEPAPDTRCGPCSAERLARVDRSRGSARERGYDAAWRRLSARAVRLQPFCTDCGTADDLTADHLPGAWEKVQAGKRLDLGDIEVVCRGHNSARGARRTSGGPAERPVR